jgi:hypothetical protein
VDGRLSPKSSLSEEEIEVEVEVDESTLVRFEDKDEEPKLIVHPESINPVSNRMTED